MKSLEIDFKPLTEESRVFDTSFQEKERLALASDLKIMKQIIVGKNKYREFKSGNDFGKWLVFKQRHYKFTPFLFLSGWYNQYHDFMWELDKYPRPIPMSALIKIDELLKSGIERRRIRIIDPLSRNFSGWDRRYISWWNLLKVLAFPILFLAPIAALMALPVDPYLVYFTDTGNSWSESPCTLVWQWDERNTK